MKLWLLRPVERLSVESDPWNPWYDKIFGFVVRAETEKDAREYAHQDAGDENDSEFTEEPWKDNKYSTCVELKRTGEPGVIINDFYRA